MKNGCVRASVRAFVRACMRAFALQVNTIPQCAINMAAVSDICDAEDTTTHQLSVAIITPDNVFYVKGTTKDEIGRYAPSTNDRKSANFTLKLLKPVVF